MTGEALKKLQQQMKVNRDGRRLTVSAMAINRVFGWCSLQSRGT